MRCPLCRANLLISSRIEIDGKRCTRCGALTGSDGKITLPATSRDVKNDYDRLVDLFERFKKAKREKDFPHQRHKDIVDLIYLGELDRARDEIKLAIERGERRLAKKKEDTKDKSP